MLIKFATVATITQHKMICKAILLVALTAPLCMANGYVPVVLWNNIGNDRCVPDLPIYPGESILKLTESSYLDCLRSTHPDVIKVFVADELDQHDLSVTRDASGEVKAFQHLQNTLKSHPSLVMPAVSSKSVPAVLEKAFRESFSGSTVSVIEVGRIDHDSLTRTRRSIALIDETINEDLLRMKADAKFIAVLVAATPPQPVFHMDEEYHHGRQLLGVTEPMSPTTQTFINWKKCIFLSYSNVTLTYQKDILNLTSPTVTGGYCDESSNKAGIDVTFKVNNGSGSVKSDVKLNLQFVNVKSVVSLITWWNISAASISHKVSGSEQNYTLKILDPYSYSSPYNWSWVCEKPKPMSWKEDKKDNPIKQNLQFQNFQLQPFGIEDSKYSQAYDCSGFLTGPIWMGTVISILLGIIFTFGLIFISAVSTMDRFDDPRSKGLSVNVQENN